MAYLLLCGAATTIGAWGHALRGSQLTAIPAGRGPPGGKSLIILPDARAAADHGHRLRQNGGVNELLDISADLPEHVFAPGDVLIEEGTEAGRLLILVSGDVIIERDGVPFAEIDQPGSVFGEMSIVLGQPASATVRAAGEVRVRVADDPDEFLTQRPGAALAVLRTTAGRLDRMTQYLVDVKSQFAEMEGHLGMVDSILNTLLHHQGPSAQRGSARDPEGDHYH